MQLGFFDSHAHYDDEKFDIDREELINSLYKNGITNIVSAGYSIKSSINALELAKKYKADIEIVELGALLHDIAMPSELGPREEHNIYGAEIAEELLTKFNYPEDRKNRVKECVLRHRGSKNLTIMGL